MTDFPKALPHGPLTEVFTDVFVVTGSFRPGALMQFPRNMVVLREGKELSVINSVRLDDETETKLNELGTVKHVVKIGAFHGMDDPYYRSRFSAKFWALPKTRFQGDLRADEDLSDTHKPFAARVFAFENVRRPEGALLVDRAGGVLVTCDSVQNWTDMEGCSFLARLVMRPAGFMGKAKFGPFWLKAQKRKDGRDIADDYRRLGALQFAHLIGGHGSVLKGEAKARYSESLERAFG
ncbi:MAG: hypothetical protein R3B13_12085 [Polyangiaceae bacterium]